MVQWWLTHNGPVVAHAQRSSGGSHIMEADLVEDHEGIDTLLDRLRGRSGG